MLLVIRLTVVSDRIDLVNVSTKRPFRVGGGGKSACNAENGEMHVFDRHLGQSAEAAAAEDDDDLPKSTKSKKMSFIV